MKLEQLRPNLGELPEDKAFALFVDYCERREKDLEQLTVTPKAVGRKKAAGGKKKKKDEVTVSKADLEILKQLGLV